MDLDEGDLTGRLIALHRVDGHAAWVSSSVLQLMNPLPANVEGGKILRDQAGNPTGKVTHGLS
jgi:predicted amidohydrolase YtcJ